jgi:molybdopterin-containing oxidoreductase family membrane subunit
MTLFLLFCRYLPVVAMAEVKTVMPQAHPHGGRTEDERRTDYRPDEHHDPDRDAPRLANR